MGDRKADSSSSSSSSVKLRNLGAQKKKKGQQQQGRKPLHDGDYEKIGAGSPEEGVAVGISSGYWIGFLILLALSLLGIALGGTGVGLHFTESNVTNCTNCTSTNVTVGPTITLPPGSPASVTNIGTDINVVLQFEIGQGEDGEDGVCTGNCTDGKDANVTAGNTTTLPPGSMALVTNVGTPNDAIFNFYIPQGADGNCTGKCTDGEDATIAVGMVTTLPPGSSCTVTNVGTPSAAIFDFGITKGDPGLDSNITVGTVTTLPPGSSCTVTNVGTPNAAIFDFGITKGDAGENSTCTVPCINGTDSTISVGMVTTLPPGSSCTVTNVGTPSNAILDFGITKGDPGLDSNITVGMVTTLPPGSSCTVTNVGTPNAAILDFGITKGDPGLDSNITVGMVTTLPPGSPCTVTNVGTPNAAIFDFGITKGDPGLDSNITVGMVTTLPQVSSCQVTNVGTPNAAIFDFGITKGDTGENGTCTAPCVNGTNPTIAVGTTTTLSAGSPATVVNVGTPDNAVLNFGIPNGSAATISVGTTSTLPPWGSAVVTNVGTSSAAVFNFQLPQGIPASVGNYSRIGIVDLVFGNDTTGAISTSTSVIPMPFKTIEAALLAAGILASSGSPIVIIVHPGLYAAPTSGLLVPSWVRLQGTNMDAVRIQRLNIVSALGTMVGLGPFAEIWDLTLEMTSSVHIVPPGFIEALGITDCTQRIVNVNITIDTSTASSGGLSNIHGISITEQCPTAITTTVLEDVTVSVQSAGLGQKRGILMSFGGATSLIRMTRCNIVCNNPSNDPTVTDYVAVDARGIGTNATIITSFSMFSGYSNDISIAAEQTDSLMLFSTLLAHSTTRGFPIVNQNTPAPLIWGDPGVLPLSSAYMRFGSGISSATNEIMWDVVQPFLASQLIVRCITAPSIGQYVIFTLRKSAADTLLFVNLTDTAIFVRNSFTAITYNTGNTVSMKLNSTAASSAADCIVSITMY